MNSETIIVGIACLLLVIIFNLLKTEIFIFLNRFVRNDTKPWAWYQKLENFLQPLNNFTKLFLPNRNFSFKQSYSWVVIASMIYWFIYSIVIWFSFSFPINITNIFKLLKECFLAGLSFSLGIILLTGLVHFLAKLFGSKGTFQKFFVIYIAYNARPLAIWAVFLFIWAIFKIEFALYLYIMFSFLLLLVPITVAIKNNYLFNWLGSFFTGLFAQLVLFFSCLILFFMLNPSIMKR